MDIDLLELLFVGFYKWVTFASAIVVALRILGLSPVKIAETVLTLDDFSGKRKPLSILSEMVRKNRKFNSNRELIF
jgi:hypothetical protein